MKDILLCNWTHRRNCSGGSESRYACLKQIFPDAELISAKDLFGKPKNHIEIAKKMDEYYLKRYEENKNILIIRDAEVGGVLDISHIPQITMFANPYNSLNEVFSFGRKYWGELIELQKKAEKTIKVATSSFMKKDMEKIGFTPDEIISNPVDIDFFKPGNKEELRKKYKIPDKRVGIWVGDSNPIKNFATILKMVDVFGDKIFWILVTKNETSIKEKNAKGFSNVDRKTMRDLYNCADFFILTSPIEGYCIAMIEAMACNLPCIVSQAGYFWDFWDPRIGYRIQWNDLSAHIEAIKIINKTKTNSRQVIIDRKLDLNTWGEKWKKLIGGINAI